MPVQRTPRWKTRKDSPHAQCDASMAKLLVMETELQLYARAMQRPALPGLELNNLNNDFPASLYLFNLLQRIYYQKCGLRLTHN